MGPGGGGVPPGGPPPAEPLPLSILDLAIVSGGSTAAEAFEASVELARRAEARGYRRVWYAEHHNIASIASSATSVLIAHVAAHTRTIRLGSGGIMLPNHSPLVIAEQFGTLATLHPGRIDLGLGRAPGTDPRTWRGPAPGRERSRVVPQGRARAAGLPLRAQPRAGGAGRPGRRDERAPVHPRLV